MDTEIIGQVDYDAMNEIKRKVMSALQVRLTPTASNIARQAMDHLDASYLFLNQFAHYMGTLDAETDAAAEDALAKGKVTNFPAPPHQGEPEGPTDG